MDFQRILFIFLWFSYRGGLGLCDVMTPRPRRPSSHMWCPWSKILSCAHWQWRNRSRTTWIPKLHMITWRICANRSEPLLFSEQVEGKYVFLVEIRVGARCNDSSWVQFHTIAILRKSANVNFQAFEISSDGFETNHTKPRCWPQPIGCLSWSPGHLAWSARVSYRFLGKTCSWSEPAFINSRVCFCVS